MAAVATSPEQWAGDLDVGREWRYRLTGVSSTTSTDEVDSLVTPVVPPRLDAPGDDGGTTAERRSRLRFHPAVVVVVGMCAVLLREAMHLGLSGDVYYQVAEGRWMLAHHAVVSHDMFSYTVLGRPWLSEEWGFALGLAWLVAHLGAVSYWLVSAGACIGALVVSVARWRKTGAGWLWTAALSILAGAAMYDFVSPRPQDLSYLLFGALLLFLTLARTRTVWLVACPPLLLLWANLHGSFLLGVGILVLELLVSVVPPLPGRLVSQRLPTKPMALTVVAGLAATLVNPHGPGLLSYSFHVSSSTELTSFIAEWQSPNFHSLFWLAVIAGPLLLLLALLAFTSTTFAIDDVALGCVMFLATLHAARFMPYFVLVMCSVLSRWAPIKRETIRPSLLTLPLAAVVCLVFLAGPHTAAGTPQKGAGTLGTPVAATAFLQHQTGRVFTTYWWSDYLIYKNIPVFVDGRTDVYFGTGILETYVNVSDVSIDPDPVFPALGCALGDVEQGHHSKRLPEPRPSLEDCLQFGRRRRFRTCRVLGCSVGH